MALKNRQSPVWHLPRQCLRQNSTTSEAARSASALTRRLRNLVYGTSFVLILTFSYLYGTDTRAGIHRWLIPRSLRWIYDDAEEAHHAGKKALKTLHEFGLNPRERGNPDQNGDLKVEVFGTTLWNPIGTSAGIDKDAEIPSALLALGPSIVEVGGVTPYPQDGNAKPRVFRLPSQHALINRYGLNSEGAETMAMRLRERVRQFAYRMGFGIDQEAEQMVLDGEAGVPPGSLTDGKLLAVQIAKNKFTRDDDIDAVRRDYVYCVEQLAKYADIIVVNVSSPNTPGLRKLQNVEPLTDILTAVVAEAKAVKRKRKPAVMVKVSPDEDSETQILGICRAVHESGVDGVIVGNTTKSRPDPLPKGYVLPAREATLLQEQGGYSGPQTFERTLALVKKYRKALDEGTTTADDPPPPTSLSSQTASKDTTTADDPPPTSPSSSPTASKNTTTPGPEVQAPLSHLLPPSETSTDPPISLSSPPLPTTVSPFLTTTAEKPEPQTQPLIQLPERHYTPSSSSSTPPKIPTNPTPTPVSKPPPSKIIFASGGIANGHQALQVLDAGASVAMIYTALVYGGVGTVSRLKREMRDELRSRKVE